jgi:hypothetical protein
MPKVAISLSRDMLEALSRGGASPGERLKELATLYVERTTRAQERGRAVADALREAQRRFEMIYKDFERDDLTSLQGNLASLMGLLEAAATMAMSLPLTKGESLFLDMLKKDLEAVEARMKGYPPLLVAASAIPLARASMHYLMSLLMDLAIELRDVGAADKSLELLDSLMKVTEGHGLPGRGLRAA